MFLVVTTWGGVANWHPVGRGQGYGSTSYSAQGSPQQRIVEPQMEMVLRLRNLDVKGKKPLFGNQKHKDFPNGHFLSVLRNSGARYEFPAVPTTFAT